MDKNGHKIVLKCDGISHSFGRNKVLYNIDLEIECGSIIALVGPSGCGKSTLLKAIVGTHPPRQGKVMVDYGGVMHQVTRPTRNIGIVYQQYSLPPFLTTRDNVALGLKLDKTTITQRMCKYLSWHMLRDFSWPEFRDFSWNDLREQHRKEAIDLLEKLGLGEAVYLYPSELSGGMQQRVAIAQVLIMKPKILLLDEPFGALDEAKREELQIMLLQLYAENLDAKKAGLEPPNTILIVTHELTEAVYVGNRVVGLSQFWDWKSEGFDSCPGATIVYDKPAPVFSPTDAKDLERINDQREEIFRVVCEASFIKRRDAFRTYWSERT